MEREIEDLKVATEILDHAVIYICKLTKKYQIIVGLGEGN